jgi:hypothetical protein
MRMHLVLGVALGALVALATSACSTVPDLVFDDGDGGADGGPCVKTGPEICDDGIDNDCNGKTDCADDACQQRYRCVDRAPDDWQLTALAQGGRPTCPDGFGDSSDVRAVRGSSGAPTCGCDCGGASACSPNGIVAGIDNSPGCGGTSQTFDASTDCQRLNGLQISGNAFVKATAGTATSCRSTANGTVAEVRDGRTCAVRRAGGGCGASQVCVPRTTSGYSVCIAKGGSQTCPGAFPTSISAGSNVQQDSRACSSCTCTAAPCTGEVKLYDNRDCSSGEKLTLAASAPPGNCDRVSNGSFQARGYTATIAGGCVMAAAGKGSGTLTLADERTICCK